MLVSIPHKLLNRQTFSAFALDWFTFKNLLLHAPGGGKDGPRFCRFSRSRRKMRLSTLREERRPGRYIRSTPYPPAADGHHASRKWIVWGYLEGRTGLRYQRADARNGGPEGGQRVARRRGDPFHPLCVAFPREITAREFSFFKQHQPFITGQRFRWPHLFCLKNPASAPLCASLLFACARHAST